MFGVGCGVLGSELRITRPPPASEAPIPRTSRDPRDALAGGMVRGGGGGSGAGCGGRGGHGGDVGKGFVGGFVGGEGWGCEHDGCCEEGCRAPWNTFGVWGLRFGV